jgi:hypothetical protein
MPILNILIDLLLSPFHHLPQEAGLTVFALLTGLVVLLVFKATSNPARVAQARNRALAHVMEIWLYRADPLLSLRAVGRVMGANLHYCSVLLVPMLASLVPMALLLVQAHDWFACRPLLAGETVLVVARLNPDADLATLDRATLTTSDERVIDPPVRAASLREVAWRVRAGDDAGVQTLVLTEDNVRLTKKLACSRNLTRVSTCRVAGFWEGMLHPGEGRLPRAQPFARLAVQYPKAEYNLLGWRMRWLPAVLILSFLSGLILMRPLRVEL